MPVPVPVKKGGQAGRALAAAWCARAPVGGAREGDLTWRAAAG